MAIVEGTEGNDVLEGTRDPDTINGRAGNDIINASFGEDLLDGGAGNDVINGGEENDTAFIAFNRTEFDLIDLGRGSDVIAITPPRGLTLRLRLTFNSAEVGNGNSREGGSIAGGDGSLAIRAQEILDGVPVGEVSRFDDEGVLIRGSLNSNLAAQATQFEIRDLAPSMPNGTVYSIAIFGEAGADVIESSRALTLAAYVNGGGGNDVIHGGDYGDYLVGGGG